ncbi:MAG: protein translocase subunit SecF [Ruminococcus sp.]|nr:protein translocase subunit SecF [Ruminococcus sp.]
MRRIKKPVFFIVVLCIALIGFLTFFGIHTYYGDTTTTIIKGVDEIRWGIDIRGGVNATFKPEGNYNATDSEMDAAKSVIEQRLINLNITDSEVYVDYDHDHVIVSFPWQAGESDFDPEAAVAELGETAILTFREGETDDGATVVTGTQIKKAEAGQITKEDGGYEWVVALELDNSGKKAFADATTKLAGTGYISIWMDDERISAPQVSNAITDGKCHISGGGNGFTYESAKALADKINAGSLPFKLVASSTNTISPTLGEGARNAIVIAGLIAFILIAIYIIVIYKLPGAVAAIALAGQVIVTIAAISGFFGNAESFTLTIPGIAGIILAIGMGVDANVITAERIKEELRNGKTLNGAIELGFKRAWSSVFDGNITVVFVALILMAAFGPTDSALATILKPLFFAFGVSTAGTIYSLGYTLLVGIILNFVFGIFCSRLMIASLSKFKCFKKLWLYGGYKTGEEKKEVKTLNVVKNKNKFYAVSSGLFVLFALVAVILGLNVAIEFKGGTLLNYSYEGDLDTKKIETVVEDTVGEKVIVKTGEQFSTGVKTVELSFASSKGLSSDKLSKLDDALTKQLPDNSLEGLSTTDVSPTNGKSFFLKCLVAVVFAAVVMVVYIGFRFKKIGGWSAGCMAVVALCHDMIMVFGSFVIFRFDIDANFMAVLLTILGYSINATIIIYDRIRENRRLYGNKYAVDELVNMSVSQTLGRSIHTTVTTVLAMAVVAVVCAICGVTSIISFALPLIVGMIAGVYSSNCIAPTLWVMWQKRNAKKAKK